MKSKRTTWLLIGALVAMVLGGATAGCEQSREIGKSTKQLFRGEAEATVEQSPAQVAQAIDAAIAEVKLIRIGATTRPSKDKQTWAVQTVVTARDTADTKVQIAYQPVTATSTHVIVSTGVLGSSELRDRVWDAVRIRLGVINVAGANGPTTQPSQAAAL
jgi:hypothetical protein